MPNVTESTPPGDAAQAGQASHSARHLCMATLQAKPCRLPFGRGPPPPPPRGLGRRNTGKGGKMELTPGRCAFSILPAMHVTLTASCKTCLQVGELNLGSTALSKVSRQVQQLKPGLTRGESTDEEVGQELGNYALPAGGACQPVRHAQLGHSFLQLWYLCRRLHDARSWSELRQGRVPSHLWLGEPCTALLLLLQPVDMHMQ